MSDKPERLIRVGRPLVRLKAQMEPCQSVDGPITSGPLISQRQPIVRLTATMEPVQHSCVQVSFDLPPEKSEANILASLQDIVEFAKSEGFIWDRWNSYGEPNKVVLRFVPRSAEATERLDWLAEQLRPQFATVANVKRLEVERVVYPSKG